MRRVGTRAQAAQNRARFHRGQLVLVTQQDQPGVRRQGIQQCGHHFDIHHGRLVHHHVQGQWTQVMVLEAPAVRTRTQQAVQGRHVVQDGLPHPLTLGQLKTVQGFDLPADRLIQTRRRLARRYPRSGCR
nr:hypothetical protein [Sediminihaliea albiluteola]